MDPVDVDFDARFGTLFACAYQAAFRVLGSRECAEDMAQEACARALARWSRVHPYAEAWVTRVASNLAIDQWRRDDRPRRWEPGEEVGRPDGFFQLRTDVVRALRTLSTRQREVVVLRYLAGFSEQDTARTLECSKGSVKKHASRGAEALRRQLGGRGGERDVSDPGDWPEVVPGEADADVG